MHLFKVNFILFNSKTKERRRRKALFLEAVWKHSWETTLTMQSLMVATPKTMRTSCDTGSITIALSPSQPSEMQLYLLMLSSAILENLNYVLPPSFCFNDQRDYTREHPVSPTLYVHTYGIAFSLSHSASTHTLTHTHNHVISVGWPSFNGEYIVTAVVCVLQGSFLLNVAPVKMADTVLQLQV